MNRLLSIGQAALCACLIAAAPLSTLGQRARQHPSQSEQAGRKFKDELIQQDIRMHDSLPRGFEEPYRSWTEDYTEINEAGELLSKEDVRARYKAGSNRRPNIPPDDHAIRIYRDTLVITHVLRKRGMKKDKDGYPVIPTVYSYRVAHVFVKRDGGWRMASTQWTPIVEAQAE
jgi:hypothetical protein